VRERRRKGQEWVEEYLIEDLYLWNKCKVTVLYVGPGFRAVKSQRQAASAAGSASGHESKARRLARGAEVPEVGGKAAVVAGAAPLSHVRFEDA